ncbi:hypothetical protein [Noviherbaspirillum suwonense]|jgi:MYXO-CTERM domain-containing protein|uniref:MYXO-CTERM domain-containing protein n=1 Tax=Noviherbaspirillum suwonense TaxID=1224511 RepID=A0ABY1PUZ5_9BURK|nr:hypothetical protein [Noviherbaspirillum suwonense]SMP49694.1 MYXO-CTERM domain-containing protein [Noviherbaspirillum suwonense]
MLRKLAATSILLAPLLAFGQGNGHGYGHGNGHGRHAPEINGGNVVLALALLGGILSLSRRRKNR